MNIKSKISMSAANTARKKFETEYAKNLKRETDEGLALALDILQRHKGKYKLSDTERQIIEQVDLLSSTGSIIKMVVAEMQSRKPMDRKTRRHTDAILRKLESVKRRGDTKSAFAEAVRTGRTFKEVQIERLNAFAETPTAD